MKTLTKILFALSAILLLAPSCRQEEFFQEEEPAFKVYATFGEDAPRTKTTVDADGYVEWDAYDSEYPEGIWINGDDVTLDEYGWGEWFKTTGEPTTDDNEKKTIQTFVSYNSTPFVLTPGHTYYASTADVHDYNNSTITIDAYYGAYYEVPSDPSSPLLKDPCMVAKAVAEEGSIKFKFQNITTLLQFELIPPSGCFINYFTIKADSRVFGREMKLDLSKDVNDPGFYNEVLDSSNELYCQINNSTPTPGTTVYPIVELLPFNFSGSKVTFIICATDGISTHAYEMPAETITQAFNRNTIYTKELDFSAIEPSQQTLYHDLNSGGEYYEGVTIGNTEWAPYNLGGSSNNPSSQFSQYGRSRSQYWSKGHSSYTPITGTYSAAAGSAWTYQTNFFYSNTFPYDWCSESPATSLWGGDSGTTKSEYDPCPEGWRVPTAEEWNNLFKFDNTGAPTDLTRFYFVTGGNAVNNPGKADGVWVGENASSKKPTYYNTQGCIFLPIIARIDGSTGNAVEKESYYWSSTASGFASNVEHNAAAVTCFMNAGDNNDENLVVRANIHRNHGAYVRCVAETPYIPVP